MGPQGSSWHESWPIIWTAQGFNDVCGFEESNYCPRSPVFSVPSPLFLGPTPGSSRYSHGWTNVLRRLLLEIPTNLAVKRSYLNISDSIRQYHPKWQSQKTPFLKPQKTTSQVPSDPNSLHFSTTAAISPRSPAARSWELQSPAPQRPSPQPRPRRPRPRPPHRRMSCWRSTGASTRERGSWNTVRWRTGDAKFDRWWMGEVWRLEVDAHGAQYVFFSIIIIDYL